MEIFWTLLAGVLGGVGHNHQKQKNPRNTLLQMNANVFRIAQFANNISYGLLSQPEQRRPVMRSGIILINECVKRIFGEGFLDERSSG